MLNKQAKGCESQASLPKNSLCACSVDSSHASVLTSRTTDSVWPILPKHHGQLAMGALKCSENAKTQPG